MNIVNGYVCQNCTDVEYAKKGIDPAHPKDPPSDGVGRAGGAADKKAEFGPAVVLSGALRPGSVSSGQEVRPAAISSLAPAGSTYSLTA